MINTLVFVRHGKAQVGRDGLPDEQRELAPSGRRSVAARFPQAFSLLEFEKGVDVQLWSSPAIRAQQTAEEVARVLGVKDIRICEALLRQDGDAFMEEVEGSSADIVVAVGHNPFMEQMTMRLSGAEIAYTTGGIAAFRMNDAEERMPARLLWFVQGPHAADWKTLCTMEKVLGRWADEIDMRLRAFFEFPDDPETMHKLRVSIRTLRSLIAFVTPFAKRSQADAVLDDLRYVLGFTSSLRDMDVLAEQVQGIDQPAIELIEVCEAVRNERRDQAIEALRTKHVRKALNRVGKAMHRVEWRDAVESSGLALDRVRERYALMLEDIGAELERGNVADVQGTHALRKHAKRIRYVSERFAELLDDGSEQTVRLMVSVQDRLGALCDARVIIAIIEGFPMDDLPEPAQWDLALIRARNEAFICTALKQSACGVVDAASDGGESEVGETAAAKGDSSDAGDTGGSIETNVIEIDGEDVVPMSDDCIRSEVSGDVVSIS